jgi:hypothetical protein
MNKHDLGRQREDRILVAEEEIFADNHFISLYFGNVEGVIRFLTFTL